VTGKGFLANQVGFIGELAGGGRLAIAFYLVIVVGKLTVNCLNAYGGSMTMLTTMSAFQRTARVSTLARALYITAFIAASVLVALLASADFLNNFKNFVLVLLMVFTPWSAINLVDYYLVARERVDVPALYDARGRYGSVNGGALLIYALGIAVQVPFLAQAMYTGPATKALGGADISWIVGLLVTAALYYPYARRTARHPSRIIYPEGVLDA